MDSQSHSCGRMQASKLLERGWDPLQNFSGLEKKQKLLKIYFFFKSHQWNTQIKLSRNNDLVNGYFCEQNCFQTSLGMFFHISHTSLGPCPEFLIKNFQEIMVSQTGIFVTEIIFRPDFPLSFKYIFVWDTLLHLQQLALLSWQSRVNLIHF